MIDNVEVSPPVIARRKEEALCRGLERLKVDMALPAASRGNPYYPGWFDESLVRRFLVALGGSFRFNIFWAHPADVQGPDREGKSWGAWARSAAKKEQNNPVPQVQGQPPPCGPEYWPKIPPAKYEAADQKGRDIAAKSDFALWFDHDIRYPNHGPHDPIFSRDYVRSTGNSDPDWPGFDDVDIATPAEGWMSFAVLTGDNTLTYNTVAPPGQQLSYRDTNTDVLMDRPERYEFAFEKPFVF